MRTAKSRGEMLEVDNMRQSERLLTDEPMAFYGYYRMGYVGEENFRSNGPMDRSRASRLMGCLMVL